VWKQYEPYSYPLTRVVYGLPTSWEQSTASVGFPSGIKTVAWSLCSKLIAVAWGRVRYGGTVEILDAGTLAQLSILPLYKQSQTQCLIFSPDTSLLTWIGQNPNWIISWDVQTGVQVSAISTELLGTSWDCSSATYSTCGTMIALHSSNDSISTISTYNILSGAHIYSHSVKQLKLKQVWTDGECLRYAVLESSAITIWEAGFTSTDTLVKVEALPLPGNFPSESILHFYPTVSRVAFSAHGTAYIWDTTCSKYLLDSTDLGFYPEPSFSSDGCFFVCETPDSRVGIWKESPTGYIFHQSLATVSDNQLCVSPNGELLLTRSSSVAQLWHITDSSIPNPTASTQASQSDRKDHLLVFSPDEALAAVTKKRNMTVTVFDLKSGVPRLIIDTGMKVYGLGVAGGTIVIVGYDDNIGDQKIVTWNIPARGCVLNLNVNIDDSVKTMTLNDQLIAKPQIISASVSPDLHYVVLMEGNYSESSYFGLYLCDVLTGQSLASVGVNGFGRVQFTRDGCGVWCIDGSYERWWKRIKDSEFNITDSSYERGRKIIKDSESNITKLEDLGSTKGLPSELTWQCPPGYKVMDGWIFHCGKRLLWLPPHWWPGQFDSLWGGQFLALVNEELPEVLILELD